MPTPTPVVRALLIAWGAVFLLELALRTSGTSSAWLAFDPLALLRGEAAALPGLLTWSFSHAGLLHILLNAWAFLLFAPEVEVLYPRRRIIALLATAAVVGTLVTVVLAALSPARFGAPVLGGSGLTMAALAAHVAVYPGRRLSLIVITFSARTLLLVLLALDILGVVAQAAGRGGQVASAVHLAGAAVGWLWVRGLGGSLAGPWQRWAAARRRRQADRRAQDARSEDAEEDRILAKISREGMTALTERERAFLKRRSERRRGGGPGHR